jgi:Tat protein secretion system quality control protein TatD with DNase activity
MMALATEVELPIVITVTEATDKVIEKLTEHASLRAAAIFNFCGSDSELRSLLDVTALPVYFFITGIVCGDTSVATTARGQLSMIPRDRLIVATDSPRLTPLTIDDAYLRESKNEPSNIGYVYTMSKYALHHVPRSTMHWLT